MVTGVDQPNPGPVPIGSPGFSYEGRYPSVSMTRRRAARVIIMLHMVGNLVPLGVLLRAVLHAVKVGRSPRRTSPRRHHYRGAAEALRRGLGRGGGAIARSLIP